MAHSWGLYRELRMHLYIKPLPFLEKRTDTSSDKRIEFTILHNILYITIYIKEQSKTIRSSAFSLGL